MFTLTTDASNVALGAVLSQSNHPICFASRTLNDHEINYSTTEKELLAIVWATKYFRPYLYGRKFIINSDHKPLQWLHNLKEPNAKLQRWKVRLNEFDFDVKYIPGKENRVADALSRINNKECHMNDAASNLATVHSADEDSSSFIFITERPLNVFRRQFLFRRGPVQRESMKIIFRNIRTCVDYIEMTQDLAKDFILNKLAGITAAIYFENDNDFILFQSVYANLVKQTKKNRVVRATKLLEDIASYDRFKEIILTIHLKGLHQGIEKIQAEFRTRYYYPNYITEISNIINDCDLCNECKFDHRITKMPFKITPPTYYIRDKYIIDIWKWDKSSYLTCIDIFSKYAMVEPLNHTNWVEAKRALLKIFNTMGPPRVIKTDQDAGLVNVSLQEWYKTLNIELEITTGKTGIADIERLHKTLNEKLRIINTGNDQELKQIAIEQTIFTYNHIIIHSTTGETPYNIFFNKNHPRKDAQAVKENRINNVNKNRKYYETDTRFLDAENSRKRLDKKANPFKKAKVLRKEGDDHYIVKLKNRNIKKYKTCFKKKKYTHKESSSRNETTQDNTNDLGIPFTNSDSSDSDDTNSRDKQ